MALRFMFAFSIQRTTEKIYFKSISLEGYKNRYDDAFGQWFAFGTNRTQTFGHRNQRSLNQINRYQNHSFEQSRLVSIRAIVCDQQWSQYKYFNNKLQSVKQTFFWADANNKKHH
jgi:type I restriction enzyme R subunit